MPSSRESSQPRSPALPVDSLPPEPPGKSKNTGVGSLSLLQGIFLTQESNLGFLHYRQIIYQLNYQGRPDPYMTTGKNKTLPIWTFVSQVMSFLFNMLSRFVIAFLPRSKHLLISRLQSLSAVILEPKKINNSIPYHQYLLD